MLEYIGTQETDAIQPILENFDKYLLKYLGWLSHTESSGKESEVRYIQNL
jgi:hypothetical protein